jgi:hypothetical protein
VPDFSTEISFLAATPDFIRKCGPVIDEAILFFLAINARAIHARIYPRFHVPTTCDFTKGEVVNCILILLLIERAARVDRILVCARAASRIKVWLASLEF